MDKILDSASEGNISCGSDKTEMLTHKTELKNVSIELVDNLKSNLKQKIATINENIVHIYNTILMCDYMSSDLISISNEYFTAYYCLAIMYNNPNSAYILTMTKEIRLTGFNKYMTLTLMLFCNSLKFTDNVNIPKVSSIVSRMYI